MWITRIKYLRKIEAETNFLKHRSYLLSYVLSYVPLLATDQFLTMVFQGGAAYKAPCG